MTNDDQRIPLTASPAPPDKDRGQLPRPTAQVQRKVSRVWNFPATRKVLQCSGNEGRQWNKSTHVRVGWRDRCEL